MHQCKLIRDAVVAKLRNHTAAEARVFVEDRRRIRRAELPAIVIFSQDETSEHGETAPRELTREMDVAIEAWVAESQTVTAADARDALALQIETAMHADPYLDDTAADSYLSRTQRDVDIEGDRMLGLAVLTYSVTYRTLAPEPPTDLDDFRRAGVTHRIAAADDNNAAHDEIVVQEAP
jgi:hypothetical protein